MCKQNENVVCSCIQRSRLAWVVGSMVSTAVRERRRKNKNAHLTCSSSLPTEKRFRQSKRGAEEINIVAKTQLEQLLKFPLCGQKAILDMKDLNKNVQQEHWWMFAPNICNSRHFLWHISVTCDFTFHYFPNP